jgi:putative Ca2+/H+ antiporter (TMEM165/GDT1 family)
LWPHGTGVFIATDVAFFAAIGDKTQIVTIPLAAAYSNPRCRCGGDRSE